LLQEGSKEDWSRRTGESPKKKLERRREGKKFRKAGRVAGGCDQGKIRAKKVEVRGLLYKRN